MRWPALLMLVLLGTPAHAQTNLTPEMCADTASVMDALTRFTRKNAIQIERAGHGGLGDGAGAVSEAAERAEIARLNLLEAMREYSDATDALADRLRACAK